MKRLIISLFACVSLLLFVGCTSSASAVVANGRFEIPLSEQQGGGKITVVVDKETNVMYMFIQAGYKGGLTVMVDENGSPLLWSEREMIGD